MGPAFYISFFFNPVILKFIALWVWDPCPSAGHSCLVSIIGRKQHKWGGVGFIVLTLEWESPYTPASPPVSGTPCCGEWQCCWCHKHSRHDASAPPCDCSACGCHRGWAEKQQGYPSCPHGSPMILSGFSSSALEKHNPHLSRVLPLKAWGSEFSRACFPYRLMEKVEWIRRVNK